MSGFLILGCGYTGERVARRLLDRGACVHATTRNPDRLARLARRHALVSALEVSAQGSVEELQRLVASMGPGLRVLYSIPVLTEPCGVGTDEVFRALGSRTERVVYLSTTAVYGDASVVDEHSLARPNDDEGRLRLLAEHAAGQGPWSTIVLRPAAIYGPQRGVHVLVRRGDLGRVRDLDRVVSRVHVEDLAAIAEAALLSNAAGAFPVADDEPATTREVAAFCHEKGGLGPWVHENDQSTTTGWRGRRVNGQAIRHLLGIDLRYPSYRTGIPAAIREEMLDEGNPQP